MGKTFDENSRVKIPALLHLTRLGYAYVSLKGAEDKFDGDTNIYRPSFHDALNRINGASLSEKETDAIVRDLRNLLDASDLERQFFDKLQGGVSFDGENLRLINYEQPDNNIFEVVTELPCKSGTQLQARRDAICQRLAAGLHRSQDSRQQTRHTGGARCKALLGDLYPFLLGCASCFPHVAPASR